MSRVSNTSQPPQPLPPLVKDGVSLSAQEKEKFSRHLLLPEVGAAGQQRLRAARVLVIGAGGLGAPLLLYLAAAGVGCIGIVEFDTVDVSNLQRQVLYRASDVGQPKLDAAAATLRERHPELQLELHALRLDAEHALALFAQYDLVLDGSDNFGTRYLVNDACVLADKPSVWGSIYRFEGQVSVFWENAPDGRGLNYRDLYPEPPPAALAPSCSEGGVFGVLCGVIGALMATEAIKLICGIGQPLLGRVMHYDALQMRFRSLPLQRQPQRQLPHTLQEIQAGCTLHSTAAEEVPQLAVQQLQQWRAVQLPHLLLDVRSSGEREIVQISGAQHLPLAELGAQLATLRERAQDMPLVVHCKSGIRSRQACQQLLAAGVANVHSLQGGILAWVRDIEPHLARY